LGGWFTFRLFNLALILKQSEQWGKSARKTLLAAGLRTLGKLAVLSQHVKSGLCRLPSKLVPAFWALVACLTRLWIGLFLPLAGSLACQLGLKLAQVLPWATSPLASS